MLCHGLLYVGKGNLEWVQEQTDKNEPDSWKGYNISNAAKVDNDPNSLMRQWRHDDEEVAYPTFELIQKNYEKLKSGSRGSTTFASTKGSPPARPIRCAAIRATCRKPRVIGRSSTSSRTTRAFSRTFSWRIR